MVICVCLDQQNELTHCSWSSADVFSYSTSLLECYARDFLEKNEKESIWFNSYRALLSNLKALRSGRDNFIERNVYIKASKHTLAHQ